jgi:UDP-N-acetylglucosamine 4,6-dehydratase/5-epimerase
MFEGKKVLITGGTGSLGQALTNRLLKMGVDTIRIVSRNEEKQIQMENKFNDKRLRFFLADIRDLNRLSRALEDIDIVFHTAALKDVPKIEYNPFEAIKTNVIGSQNVIDACLEQNVEKVICIGTDKAVSPLNTYGATKTLMEKLFVAANNYANPEKHRTKFIAVRYGNVLGSSSSVIPRFINQIKSKQEITITDPKMTRFSITMEEALDFIIKVVKIGKGSEIFLPKLQAYSIMDIKKVLTDLLEDTNEKIIGIRPGEKLHETLISKEEIRYSWEIDDMYMITNSIFDETKSFDPYTGIKRITNMTEYSSDNVKKMSHEHLKSLIQKSGLLK